MIPAETLLLFLFASAALAIVPGPDNIFVLSQSAMHGPRAGLIITLGLCTGLLVHIAAVAGGVAAVLQASALAFTVLKLVGAGYLLFLAWQAFRAGSQQIQSGNQPLAARALYVRGIVMNVSNPKVAVFFLAFLPQFADPMRGPVWVQILMLGALFMATAWVVFSAIAWAAGGLGQWLGKTRGAQVAINRMAGVVFVLLACRLALG